MKIVRQRTIAVMTRDGQPVIRDGQPVTDIVYNITRASNYEAVNREIVARQLAKAGFREIARCNLFIKLSGDLELINH